MSVVMSYDRFTWEGQRSQSLSPDTRFENSHFDALLRRWKNKTKSCAAMFWDIDAPLVLLKILIGIDNEMKTTPFPPKTWIVLLPEIVVFAGKQSGCAIVLFSVSAHCGVLNICQKTRKTGTVSPISPNQWHRPPQKQIPNRWQRTNQMCKLSRQNSLPLSNRCSAALGSFFLSRFHPKQEILSLKKGVHYALDPGPVFELLLVARDQLTKY